MCENIELNSFCSIRDKKQNLTEMVGDPLMVDRKGWDSLGGLDLDRKNASQSWEEIG